MNVSMCKIDTEPDHDRKILNLREMGLISTKTEKSLHSILFEWDSVTRSGDWEICAVPGRFLDNRGELAHMLSHNRLIITYDVGMCLYHMMKLMKMVSTLQYHTNSNGSLFSFRWCSN